MNQFDLVVVGGGAAGFFTAINTAIEFPKASILIIEKSNKLLAKVAISGGGRCNVTHACFDIDLLSKNYPRGQQFVKKAFHWFNTNNTLEWFAQRNVPIVKEADGRMFPKANTSSAIIQCFLREAERLGIGIWTNKAVISIQKNKAGFTLSTQNQQLIQAKNICLACGGFPKLEQYQWLNQLELPIVPPVPSLFTFNLPNNPITALMGVSVPSALVKIKQTSFQQKGPLLITHWGLSGPAVLKLSAWAARELAEGSYQFQIQVNWLPEISLEEIANIWQSTRNGHGNKKVITFCPYNLPQRLWQYFIQLAGITDTQKWADITAKQKQTLSQILQQQVFEVKGKTTFKEEFVTSGGIDVKAIDVNTMESKQHKGLYFAGEMINVDGVTGGFNFQHAWTSGWIAAKAIANQLKNVEA